MLYTYKYQTFDKCLLSKYFYIKLNLLVIQTVICKYVMIVNDQFMILDYVGSGHSIDILIYHIVFLYSIGSKIKKKDR